MERLTCVLPAKCWCPPCRKAYDAARFQRTKSIRYGQVKQRRKDLGSWLSEIKSRPCADCGNCFHPAAMQFDHLGDKEFDVARKRTEVLWINPAATEAVNASRDQYDIFGTVTPALRVSSPNSLKDSLWNHT